MPKRELWPAGPGSESVTHIGNCGGMMSTTSTHSGSSDSSYDFLSAEEKECLLFLEKTIGSLEAEADSGLSTDESEPATSPRSFRALPTTTQQAPKGKPEDIDIQQVSVPKRVAHSSSPPETHSLGLRSGSYSLPRNLHLGRSQNLRESATQTNSPVSEAPEVFLKEPEKGQTSQGAQTVQPPAPSLEGTLDLNTVLIPPPEAFQDIRPKKSGGESPSKKAGEQTHTPQDHSLDRSPHSQKKVEMSSETVSHKATEKGWTEGPQQPHQPPAQSSQNTKAEEASLSSGVKPNIQQAPLTASKPRRLPPNIVLKSSRSSFHSHPQNWLSNHTEATDSGPVSSLQEQRKARREALEKLGLPQDQDDSSLLVNKHTSTLKIKEAQAQTPSQAQAPVQPASPALVSGTASAAQKASPVKAVTPMDSLSKGWISAQETPPGKVAAAKSMPIPIPKASKENSSRTQPKPDPRLTLQESSIPGLRQMNFKSNTLERSGVGLSSYLLEAEKDPSCQTSTSLGKSPFLDKVSPSVFRNSRPRPASLGTGKDFAGIQGGKLVGLEQGQCSQQSSFKGQSHDKLPRPPCVSVKISPKGIPDGHRREALKKLGLLKE